MLWKLLPLPTIRTPSFRSGARAAPILRWSLGFLQGVKLVVSVSSSAIIAKACHGQRRPGNQ